MASAAPPGGPPGQRILPPGAIQKVMVIDLENEDADQIFGVAGTYIHDTLGADRLQLLQNYYATGHVSLDNYIAQVSGQSSNYATNSDCIGSTGNGSYGDVITRHDDGRSRAGRRPGLRLPSSGQTIGDQLDAASLEKPPLNWRMYAEDMGNDPARDGGTADPLGGTDCATQPPAPLRT